MTGLPFNVAHTFLNDIGQEVRDGQEFPSGLVTDGLTAPDAPVVFIRVSARRPASARARPGPFRVRDSATRHEGVGVAVFATEQQAKDASEALRPPPGGPEVRGVDIYEVGAVA